MQHKRLYALFACVLAAMLLAGASNALPDGITITPLGNQTASPSDAGVINTSGGSITTMNLNGTTQNTRWKAFVGNVSGKLTLDDSDGYTIYDWSLSTITGEVYATRQAGTINWTGIGCANSTHIASEDAALNHTNVDDNITRTFSQKVHRTFYAGTNQITQNSCYSIHTFVNDSSQNTNFEEMVTYDGTNLTDGSITYVTLLEENIYGYNNNTFDFQLIVPERGLANWQSSTAYYFYMELT